jgi:cytochrome P450
MTKSVSRQDILDNIDHHSAYFREHNYEIYDDLRAQCPVAHSNAWDGFWLFCGYDVVYQAAQATNVFSSAPQKAIPMASDAVFIPIDSDPPLLARYRSLVLPRFSPVAAKNYEPTFRELATQLIDEFIESGRADLVGQLTTPLPAIWMLQMLGFDGDWTEWVTWIHTVVHERSADPEKAGAAVTNIYASIAREIDKRRTNGYTDDLFSTIMRGHAGDRPLTDSEISNFGFQMLLGGLDTTSGLTGNALAELGHRRELRERLIAEPELLPGATEEFLRHSTPVQGVYRLVVQDCEVAGQTLRAGDRVILLYAAANRDPLVFDEPSHLDVERKPNRHLAFGAGPHRCLGSNFARVMFGVIVSCVLERLPDYTIAGEVERFPDAGDVYAVRRLPVTFTPGKRQGNSSWDC